MKFPLLDKECWFEKETIIAMYNDMWEYLSCHNPVLLFSVHLQVLLERQDPLLPAAYCKMLHM